MTTKFQVDRFKIHIRVEHLDRLAIIKIDEIQAVESQGSCVYVSMASGAVFDFNFSGALIAERNALFECFVDAIAGEEPGWS